MIERDGEWAVFAEVRGELDEMKRTLEAMIRMFPPSAETANAIAQSIDLLHKISDTPTTRGRVVELIRRFSRFASYHHDARRSR